MCNVLDLLHASATEFTKFWQNRITTLGPHPHVCLQLWDILAYISAPGWTLQCSVQQLSSLCLEEVDHLWSVIFFFFQLFFVCPSAGITDKPCTFETLTVVGIHATTQWRWQEVIPLFIARRTNACFFSSARYNWNGWGFFPFYSYCICSVCFA